MGTDPKNSRATSRRALANEIAQAIRLRMFRPGEWLRQIDLEERFQATRFDVRGALDELAVRKTIEHVPNRGYRVAEIDMKTWHDIRDTRLILETAAAAPIVARIDAEGISRLRELAAAFSRAVESGTRSEQSETNRLFHETLLACSGNPVLQETIWALRDRSRGSTVTVWSSRAAMARSDADHHAMVAAIEAGDPGELGRIIERHIRMASEGGE